MHLYKIILSLLFSLFSIICGQRPLDYKLLNNSPNQSGKFENSIFEANKFTMNQGFSIMTSVNNGISETTGIYSNFSTYKLSEKIEINSIIHLFNNPNNSINRNNISPSIGYQIGLEYKLSPNSFISFQMINYNQPLSLNNNISNFNAP